MNKFSLISGFISAVLFVLPAIKQERRRRQYADFQKQSKGGSDEKLAAAVKEFMLKDLIRWSGWDSLFIFLGLFFLALSFILELVIK